jgi:ribosomal protein L29
VSNEENFKVKSIEEKKKQILSLQDKLFQLREDLKNNSTLGIV